MAEALLLATASSLLGSVGAPLAIVGAEAGFAVGSAALASTLGSVGTTLAITAVSFGAQLLLADNRRPKQDPGQLQVKQSLPNRYRGYGQARLGGAYFFFATYAGGLYTGLVHCEGPIQGFDNWILNDTNTNLPGGSLGGVNTALPWSTVITIESRLGTTTQAVSGLLATAFSGWTPTHQLKGLAYSVVLCGSVRQQDFSKRFPSGAPALRVTAKLSLVWDPRSGSDPNVKVWTDNPAPCILDFLISPRGMNIPVAMIDINSFLVFENVADEAVPLASGGTIPRWRIGGVYDCTVESRETLRALLAAVDAELHLTGEGKIAIRGGAWEAPTVTITDDWLIRAPSFERGVNQLAAFNRLKISFTSPQNDWQLAEGQAWDDVPAQVAAGRVLQQEAQWYWVQSHSQARRLAKIMTAKENPRWKVTVVTGARGLLAIDQRIVTLRLAELGIDETFRVVSWKFVPGSWEVELTLWSLAASAYAWNAAIEEGQGPLPPPPVLPGPQVPTVPTSIALTVERTVIDFETRIAQIRATCAIPPNASWETIGRYRPVGSGTWLDMTDAGAEAVLSSVVSDGTTFEVQLAHVTFGAGLQSAWSASFTILVTNDPDAPGPVTALSTSVAGSTVSVFFTLPNTPNVVAGRVYRAPSGGTAVLISPVYASPNQAVGYPDTGIVPGTYDYYVDTINGSGVAGPLVGPVIAVVT